MDGGHADVGGSGDSEGSGGVGRNESEDSEEFRTDAILVFNDCAIRLNDGKAFVGDKVHQDAQSIFSGWGEEVEGGGGNIDRMIATEAFGVGDDGGIVVIHVSI